MSFCPTCLDDIMCEIEYYFEYKWVKDLYRKAGKARKAVADRKMIKDQTIRIRDLKTGVIRVSCDTITDRWEATYISPSTSFLKVRYLMGKCPEATIHQNPNGWWRISSIFASSDQPNCPDSNEELLRLVDWVDTTRHLRKEEVPEIW